MDAPLPWKGDLQYASDCVRVLLVFALDVRGLVFSEGGLAVATA